MNPWIVFLLGVLIGWLLEWIIDWAYWRRKTQPETVVDNSAQLEAAQKEIAELKVGLLTKKVELRENRWHEFSNKCHQIYAVP